MCIRDSHWAAYDLGPWHSDAEWQQFQQLGELGYMAKEKKQAVEFISANPGWYAWTTLRRAVFIWTGFWSFDRSYPVSYTHLVEREKKRPHCWGHVSKRQEW